jgi:hypothetical protein
MTAAKAKIEFRAEEHLEREHIKDMKRLGVVLTPDLAITACR